MSAGQPGIFIDHGGHEIGNLGVAALPQCPKGTGRGNDGQIVDVVTRRDFRKFIRHTCAASHAGDQSRAVFEHTFQNLFSPAFFLVYLLPKSEQENVKECNMKTCEEKICLLAWFLSKRENQCTG